ncbi:hypothetical protein RA28_17000 [Ruegeria sp. ANG-S4]|uniref:hypothetical protein n=1 Tax=Ruegeria sp. ANG-S4 TaxID=1577904 RepID=UPI00057DA018|nr:hypothetical protein [Ruegeria sp. ANG-S4]KIC44587.1 hypothetical protein RA28_17000 [Ruegeria sp. ANG-S4]
MTIKHFFGCAAVLLLPQIALAAPTPQATCQVMVDTDPSGQITMEECLCTYQVADQILDDDIKELLFKSWYTGENVTDQLNALPNPKRVKKQFSRMERGMKQNCL